MRWIILPIGLALYTFFSQGGSNGLLQGNQNARMHAVGGFSQDELRSGILSTLEAIENSDREFGRRGPGHFPRPNSFNRN